MNIIKFRIYNPDTKKLIYSGATPTMLSSFFKVTAVLNVKHGQEYEQFSGEKDTNKVEIFDGDIVEAYIYGDEVSQVLPVEYRGSSFLINYEDSESDCVPVDLFAGTLKVIGNIHEHPEL